MALRLDLFICYYIFVLCLFPRIFLLFINKVKNKVKIFMIFHILYFISLMFLTLTNISISNGYIYFYGYESKCYFKINIERTLSLYNFYINLLLFFPFGFYMKLLNIVQKKFLNPTLFALFLSITIELFQIIIPVNRVFDLSDILFDCIACYISFNIIKTPNIGVLL